MGDRERALYYVRNRYYSPEMGRFISADPFGFTDGPSQYQFALYNPLSNSDPTGEIALIDNLAAGAFSVLVGVGVEAASSWYFEEEFDYTLQDAAIDFGLGFASHGLSGLSKGVRFAGEIALDIGAEYVRNTIDGEESTLENLTSGALVNYGIGRAGSGLANKLKIGKHFGDAVDKAKKWLEPPSTRIPDAGRLQGAVEFDPDSIYFARIDTNIPGRPDPEWSIDSLTFSSGKVTDNGGLRNRAEFWQQWMELRPETISPNNRFLIENLQTNPRGAGPRIDQTWADNVPGTRPYLDLPSKQRGLTHHHVDQGQYAIPVPSVSHRGSGGPWHGYPLKEWDD